LPDQTSAPIPRHYGLDWLRIGAFALLILFHLGLYFAPGHWIVKSLHIYDWVAWPLAGIVPWRLSVLFAVSGYATAAMIRRSPGLRAFLMERSKRLLIPLLFGMLVIVPPQDWVRLEVDGIHHPFAWFLAHDAFSFTRAAGTFMPGWEHLWFLPYLWAYTLLLVAMVALGPRWHARAHAAVDWLAAGRRLIWLPAVTIALAMALLGRTHVQGLADSADYVPAFLIGFGYAHVPALREGFGRQFREAAFLSLAALAVLWGLMAFGSPEPGRLEEALGLAAGSLMSWAMIPVAFTLADRFLNSDHKWRRPLAAAVFPAYIVHQTAIVFTGWQLREAGIVGLPALAIQLAAVLTACIAAWWLALKVPLIGTLLGMPHRAQKERPARLAPA
jgi:peptidoglycan/LPS O-acetylase OafA/YrhL